jgi:hypothetical protein
VSDFAAGGGRSFGTGVSGRQRREAFHLSAHVRRKCMMRVSIPAKDEKQDHLDRQVDMKMFVEARTKEKPCCRPCA